MEEAKPHVMAHTYIEKLHMDIKYVFRPTITFIYNFM